MQGRDGKKKEKAERLGGVSVRRPRARMHLKTISSGIKVRNVANRKLISQHAKSLHIASFMLLNRIYFEAFPRILLNAFSLNLLRRD